MFLAAALSILFGSAPIEPGRYCLSEQIFDETVEGERFALGELWMVVDVQRRGRDIYVEFENKMPDSNRRLRSQGQGRPRPDGTVRFKFTDTWGNQGVATLSRLGVITLTSVVPAADVLSKNVLRNYGTYRLTRKACEISGLTKYRRLR